MSESARRGDFDRRLPYTGDVHARDENNNKGCSVQIKRQYPRLIPAFIPGALLLSGIADAAGFESEIKLGAGVRTGQLDWSIAGDTSGANPNILSELTWRDLKILDLSAEFMGTNAGGYFVRGTVNYGLVWDGENQDSDYDGDNRTLEFSRSINDVGDSRVWGIKFGLGKEFPFGAKHENRVIPLIGYSYQVQDMRMTNGNQVIPATGSFPGLHSSYEATWAGFWLGADVQFALAEGAQMQARLEVHWPQFDAQANWNLRDDFDHPVSFEHEADGNAYVFGLNWRKPLLDGQWVLGLDYDYQLWETDPGNDYTYGANCNCYGLTQLNGVNWKTSAIHITFSRDL